MRNTKKYHISRSNGVPTGEMLQKNASTILKIANKNLGVKPIYDTLNWSEIETILCAAEEIALASREGLSVLVNGPDALPYIAPSRFDEATMQLYSSVSVTNDRGILQIKTPLTFQRQKNESWYLTRCIHSAIDALETSIDRSIFVQPPVYAIVKRRAPRIHAQLRDNENYESSRILNEIFARLGFSDACFRVSYASTTEISDSEQSVTFTIVPIDRLPEFLDELTPVHSNKTALEACQKVL